MITPSFSTDFTSALLDGRITFARSLATATRVNASGLVESVLADTSRFDYDPITLVCRGLLIEEARSNICRYSNDFANVFWTKLRLSVSSNAATAPDGTNTADKLVEDNQLGGRNVNAAVTATAAPHTLTAYLKAGERSWAALRLFNSSSFFAYFDLLNGVAGTVTAGATSTITPAGNGWYRCSITLTTAASDCIPSVFMALSNGVFSYQGDGTSGIYVWGAQLEAGAFATSYIPTTTTALTRNADVATITGTNFSGFWRSGPGSILVRALPSTVSGTRPLVQVDDTTANEIIALRGNTTNPELYIVDGGSPQAQIDAGTIAANTAYALVGVWSTNNCAARLDSNAPVFDTSATIPTVTQMRIGSDGTNYLNGHVASIDYYDQFFGYIYTRRKNKVVFSVF